MSIFKSKGMILKIDKIKPGEFLYTVFTRDYGKIKCNKKLSKQEKTLDLGYIINFEIITKENVSIHKISNIKIVSEYNNENKSFSDINKYLSLLAKVYKNTPSGSPIFELYDLLETINSIKELDKTKLVLANLKVNSIFGELGENHENETVSRILKFINTNKIDRILKLTGIGEEVLSLLEKVEN